MATTGEGSTAPRKPVKKATAKPVKAAAKKPAVKTQAIGSDVTAVITRVAQQMGIPPEVALSIAQQESGLNPQSVGDNGTSFGLFQLHQGGELGSHDQAWAFNPENNARQALSVVAHVRAQHPEWDWGTVAAAAQRPADQAGYASSVNSILGGYQQSGQTAHDYFHSAGPAQMTALDPAKPETVSQFVDSLGSQYGYLSAYIKQPGVGQLLMTAAKEGWNSGEMLSALNGNTVNGHKFPQAKQWWDSTSQSARQMQALQRTDPASYREQYNTTYTQVSQLATSMGLTVPKARLNQLTTTALWSGWSADQLNEAIGAEFHYKPGQAYAGTAGADIQKFKQLASAYLVPVADKTLGSWTQQALQGKIKPDEFTGYLAEQAKTLFPWMAQAIDSGVTPDQYLSPYRQAAAQTLELDPNAVNFNDPKWLSLVQATDPKTGQRTETGLANAMTMMRTDPRFGYDKTQGAKDQASAFASSLAHQFGYQGDSGSGISGVSNPAA